jgi:hypothetical protein
MTTTNTQLVNWRHGSSSRTPALQEQSLSSSTSSTKKYPVIRNFLKTLIKSSSTDDVRNSNDSHCLGGHTDVFTNFLKTSALEKNKVQGL